MFALDSTRQLYFSTEVPKSTHLNCFKYATLNTMRIPVLAALLALTTPILGANSSPVVHFTLARRGGAFPTENVANLTYLAEELASAEARFNQTKREINGNKVVRKPKEKGVGGGDFGLLMGEVGQQGRWYVYSA